MIVRLHGDETGETHLTRLDLPSGVLQDIATTTMSIYDLTERIPSHDFRPGPDRQLVIVLRGAFEIGTTDGARERFGPGDCLWEVDQGSAGHSLEDVGDEFLMTAIVGIPADWELPATPSA